MGDPHMGLIYLTVYREIENSNLTFRSLSTNE
jgi:hypothetical protein